MAIKYLLGCHFTYEEFGETIIDLKDTDRIQSIVDYLKKLKGDNAQVNE